MEKVDEERKQSPVRGPLEKIPYLGPEAPWHVMLNVSFLSEAGGIDSQVVPVALGLIQMLQGMWVPSQRNLKISLLKVES